MPDPMIQIESASDLERLTDRRRFVFRLDHSQLALRLGLPPDDTRDWERRLNAAYADCGCDVGSYVVLVSLLAYLLVIGVLIRPPLTTAAEVWIGLAILCAAVVVGKLTGLYIAGSRFRAAVVALLRVMGNPPVPAAGSPGRPDRRRGSPAEG